MTIALVPLIVGIIIFCILFVVIKVGCEVVGVDARIAKLLYLLLAVIFVLWLLSQLLGVGFTTIKVGGLNALWGLG